MMLRRLRIEHFRGIESADWSIDRRLVGLIGAGDSTKTTLLDALGLVLSPSYYPIITDGDFHGFDLSRSILIEAVVTDLPDNLVKESQLGKERSGLMPDGTLLHDPVDEAEECLIIRLTISPELDPMWEVIRPESGDTRPISAGQRRQLGFFRLGERTDLHLRWARGSALSGLTDGTDGASSVILDAHRAAREAVFNAEPNALHTAASTVQRVAGNFGAGSFNELRPGLEPSSAASSHALVLHDREVPLSSFGLGTRRLASLSIQDQAMAGGSIIAIDEVEYGLEPHRLAQALRYLKNRTGSGELQVIMTTHSPIAVEALHANDLVVVHSNEAGGTICHPVPDDMDNVQGAFRKAPSALLGRRVLVCEGATEVGFMRGLLHQWDTEQIAAERPTAAATGTVIVNGKGGTQPAQSAQIFRRLGYPTCMLVDNDDRSIDEPVKDAEAVGVKVHRWTVGNALEDEVIQALPAEGLQALVMLAVDLKGQQSIQSAVGSRLNKEPLFGTDILYWQTQAQGDDETIRKAIAGAAKKQQWFKNEDKGEELAGVLINYWGDLQGTPLLRVVHELRAFVYPVAPEPPLQDIEQPANE